MTHPARYALANDLRDRHPELNAVVINDSARSTLACAQAAWRAAAADATHHLVLQDDVSLCDGFLDAVHDAIAMRPGDALALFTEWGSRTAHLSRIAALRGAGWAEVADEYVPTVALVLPADKARRFGSLAIDAATDNAVADDVAMRAFLPAAYVRVPNLVEHLAVPSAAGNDEMGERRSVCYFPRAGGIDSYAIDGLPVTPHFSWWEGRSVCCVRSGAGWRKIPAREFLAGRGVNATDVLAEAALRDSADVSEILLRGLYLTAFSIGLIAAPRDPSAPLDPVADRALGTLPAGALRRFVPRARLAEVADRLKPVIVSAVRHGARYGQSLTRG